MNQNQLHQSSVSVGCGNISTSQTTPPPSATAVSASSSATVAAASAVSSGATAAATSSFIINNNTNNSSKKSNSFKSSSSGGGVNNKKNSYCADNSSDSSDLIQNSSYLNNESNLLANANSFITASAQLINASVNNVDLSSTTSSEHYCISEPINNFTTNFDNLNQNKLNTGGSFKDSFVGGGNGSNGDKLINNIGSAGATSKFNNISSNTTLNLTSSDPSGKTITHTPSQQHSYGTQVPPQPQFACLNTSPSTLLQRLANRSKFLRKFGRSSPFLSRKFSLNTKKLNKNLLRNKKHKHLSDGHIAQLDNNSTSSQLLNSSTQSSIRGSSGGGVNYGNGGANASGQKTSRHLSNVVQNLQNSSSGLIGSGAIGGSYNYQNGSGGGGGGGGGSGINSASGICSSSLYSHSDSRTRVNSDSFYPSSSSHGAAYSASAAAIHSGSHVGTPISGFSSTGNGGHSTLKKTNNCENQSVTTNSNFSLNQHLLLQSSNVNNSDNLLLGDLTLPTNATNLTNNNNSNTNNTHSHTSNNNNSASSKFHYCDLNRQIYQLNNNRNIEFSRQLSAPIENYSCNNLVNNINYLNNSQYFSNSSQTNSLNRNKRQRAKTNGGR